MSFYLKFKGGTLASFESHINSESVLNDVDISNIDYLQADGQELQEIGQFFITNIWTPAMITIPYGISPVQRWYGDIARSIVYSLPQFKIKN